MKESEGKRVGTTVVGTFKVAVSIKVYENQVGNGQWVIRVW